MATRLTYTTGSRSPELDRAFESALAEVHLCRWKSSGLSGKGGLGPYYVQQFAREQSRTIVGE
jgi:hypothetical protein